MRKVSFTLKYDEQWKAVHQKYFFSAGTLNDLKKQITAKLQKDYPGETIETHLYFDMQDIPQWFHQYQNHYFNMVLKIQPKKIHHE